MKTKLGIILFSVGLALTTAAQIATNVAQIKSAQFKTILETNWVKPGPYLRVVNGTTYNIAYSKLWGSPTELTGGLPILANNGHPIRYEVVAGRIVKDEVFCDIDAITYWWETWTGVQQDEFRDPVKTVVIYHYPNPEQLVTGKAFSCRCMRVTNYIADGISYEAYDCGVQATNLVPVVTSVKTKITP